MTTNEFERDLNDQAGLKRPGRVDLRVLQNTADAGDGNPGVQRCFRNYLHEGGMEKDLQLVGYGIKGTSVDINNAEMQQLSNIGANTISGTQWGYLGVLDQNLRQADSPTFVGLTLSADLVTTSTIDGVDVGDLKTAFDNHKANDGSDHSFINQNVKTTATPTFNGLSANNQKITSVLDPTTDQDAATRKYVNDYIKGYFPTGTILMYNGIGWTDNVTIPGWYKCDGNNGTPNLVDKFIRSEASSGNTDGSDDAVVVQHNHGASSNTAGAHTHNLYQGVGSGLYTALERGDSRQGYWGTDYIQSDGDHDHAITVNNEGVSGVGANKPSYYSLIFIMRVS